MHVSCAKTLTWVELVPILSFAFQRGACKSCKAQISWQYPLVEFLAGALFVIIFLLYPPVGLISSIVTILELFILCILMVIAIYDIKHKIIPDALVWIFVAAAFILMFVGTDAHPFVMPSVLHLLAGPILALPFALLWYVSHGEWMGLGDAKLILGIGWMLGLSYGLTALMSRILDRRGRQHPLYGPGLPLVQARPPDPVRPVSHPRPLSGHGHGLAVVRAVLKLYVF